MPFIYRNYGKIREISEIEKVPDKVRVYHPREKRVVYGPRRLDNIRRTRQICVRRLSAALEEFGRPLLLTLTFQGDASDAARANDALRRLQVRLPAKYPDAHSLFVIELSPRGRIHFHGLVFNVPLHLGDTRDGRRVITRGTERTDRILAGLWGEGFVDATQTDGSRKLAYYISKYITKGAGEPLFNAMRLLRISNGFPKEIVIRGSMAETLARRYEKMRPVSVWNNDKWEISKKWFGKMTKKTYDLENP
ncbi:MAG: hypothetical protein Q7S84_00440 [bacterium]|nr:hypothetical protein [bacterium]